MAGGFHFPPEKPCERASDGVWGFRPCRGRGPMLTPRVGDEG